MSLICSRTMSSGTFPETIAHTPLSEDIITLWYTMPATIGTVTIVAAPFPEVGISTSTITIDGWFVPMADLVINPFPEPVQEKAYTPSPGIGETDVDPNVVLSWAPGDFAPAIDGHTVYFGEVFDDVQLWPSDKRHVTGKIL